MTSLNVNITFSRRCKQQIFELPFIPPVDRGVNVYHVPDEITDSKD